MLADGRADALMAYDLDRAFRDPRDLEDMIDMVASTGT
jgi:site-specific DNA recombinase